MLSAHDRLRLTSQFPKAPFRPIALNRPAKAFTDDNADPGMAEASRGGKSKVKERSVKTLTSRLYALDLGTGFEKEARGVWGSHSMPPPMP